MTERPLIPDLESLFARHEKAVLAFSGGKDSLVVLHLCRDYRDQIDVCWVNTGAMFPHMEKFTRAAAKDFNFVELSSDVEAWRREFGDPADVVPTFNSYPGLGIKPFQPRAMLSHWSACCLANRLWPLTSHVAQSGATLWVHGQRRADPVMSGFMPESPPEATVELAGIIQNWSDEDVARYIDEHGIELPSQYSADPPAPRSLECWSCTAMLGEGDRLNYTRAHHPELYQRLRPRLAVVWETAHAALAATREVLGDLLAAEQSEIMAALTPKADVTGEKLRRPLKADIQCPLIPQKRT
ncbi:MAG: phosphoadenosine phosphosulfate reductase domain-containing protein [Planctomycetota bacterium]|jgi:3'-phosphoadenosine 5'-phosphosulfate sulfotransferase (PAPS reductase)/FAD synthetase